MWEKEYYFSTLRWKHVRKRSAALTWGTGLTLTAGPWLLQMNTKGFAEHQHQTEPLCD